MSGLSNAKLRELGGRLKFRAGLPQFFDELRGIVSERAERDNLDVSLEHYIISTGIAEMIRGSSIAGHVDGIFGCEFVEEPLPPYFSRQPEFDLADLSHQITQIGMIVDNTIKTRFVFEINKGTNKNPQIDVNSNIAAADRRVPIRNMIYIADGPSDVPVFSVVRKGGERRTPCTRQAAPRSSSKTTCCSKTAESTRTARRISAPKARRRYGLECTSKRYATEFRARLTKLSRRGLARLRATYTIRARPTSPLRPRGQSRSRPCFDFALEARAGLVRIFR